MHASLGHLYNICHFVIMVLQNGFPPQVILITILTALWHLNPDSDNKNFIPL